MQNEANFERMRKDRLQRVQREIANLGLGGIYVTEGSDVRYVTGVRAPGVTAFVPREGEPILYVRERDKGYVEREYRNIRAASRSGHDSGTEGTEKLARWSRDMKAAMEEFGLRGEKLGVPLLEVDALRALVEQGIDVVDGRNALVWAKRIKTQDEVTCFRIIGGWYRDIMARFREAVQPGLTEIELAAVVHHAAVRNGVEEIFQLNVCAGENMNPWRRWPTTRKVRAEEFVGIDLHVVGPAGCWADVSRTYYCGEKPTQEQKDLYRRTFDYLRGVISLLKPGERIDEVVKKTPPVPEKYQESLRNYSIAHSDAMRPHEYPRVEWKKPSPEILEPNMVFSVETYFGEVRDVVAVKMEELVVVTEKGPEVLSTAGYDERLI